MADDGQGHSALRDPCRVVEIASDRWGLRLRLALIAIGAVSTWAAVVAGAWLVSRLF